MNNPNTIPQKSSDLSRSPPKPNSNYPHAYLNANSNAHSSGQMLHHQNYNNQQPNYMPNYNNYYYQYPNYQPHPPQHMMPPNFNYYQNPHYNTHQMPQNFYPNGQYQQRGHSNQQFNNGHAPYNRNNNSHNNNNKHFKGNKNQNKQANANTQKMASSPEQDKFYCESCERGFKVEEKYNEHCQTHKTVNFIMFIIFDISFYGPIKFYIQKCNINGCKFTAAAKLVEIHFRNVILDFKVFY